MVKPLRACLVAGVVAGVAVSWSVSAQRAAAPPLVVTAYNGVPTGTGISMAG